MKFNSVVLFAGLILFISGCQKEAQIDRKTFIQQKVEERLADHRKIRIAACRDRYLQDATKLVDSLLIERARMEKDTIGKPPKPVKPTRPHLLSPLDSTPVKPLFEK